MLNDFYMCSQNISYLKSYFLKIAFSKKFAIFLPIFNRFLPEFRRLNMRFQPAGKRPDRTGRIFQPAGPDRFRTFQPVPALGSGDDQSAFK